MRHNQQPEDEPQLATSRAAHGQERAVLAILRALTPRRRLETLGEAETVAELQANRLLELAGLPQPPVPTELISELPRIRVRRDIDLPASGSARWQNGRWVLTVNGSEPYTRQRFSLAHEFKHVIDHPHVELYRAGGIDLEQLADYFAACLLMPKREVKRRWYGGCQRLSELSDSFEVSPAAMARRLQHLGLRPAAVRRYGQSGSVPSGPTTYYRPKSLTGVAA